MLCTHILNPQSDSTLHPERCTTAIDNFLVCFNSIFLACNTSCSCQNKLNRFCHICGEVVLKSQRKAQSKLMNCILAVRAEIKIEFEQWEFATGHAGWFKGPLQSICVAVLMMWHEPQDHLNDCYFCLTKITGFSWFSKDKIDIILLYPLL